MRLLTLGAQPALEITEADDTASYVIGVMDRDGDEVVSLTHPSLMTRGEALFELVKWKHSDSTRKHVICKVTVVE